MEKFSIINSFGELHAKIKTDLVQEEFEGYLPTGYSNEVIELSIIESKTIGKGYGKVLMMEFLSSPFVAKAELIFLDPNPYLGLFAESSLSPDEQIEKLKIYYSQFGFKCNPKSNRMWLVKSGYIDINNLPL